MTLNYHDICEQVIRLDATIRFAGIASIEAKILATEFREDVAPLLTRQESELSIMQSLMRMSIRKTLEDKLGKTLYATAVYQKVKRATIPMYQDNKAEALLMVSFEKEAELEAIVANKILPYLTNIGKTLADQYT